MRWIAAVVIVGLSGTLAALVAPGYLLEGPQAPLEKSDAIVVISGDEGLARFREGIRLYRAGWAPTLVFSGAAQDGVASNAAVMRAMALAEGIPQSAVLTDEVAQDTLGNALHTRALLQGRGLRSAIVVTSPYHVRRAVLTFQAVYQGSGIRVIGRSAPDSDWRKASWWARPATRALTFRELEKLGYVTLTGRYN